MLMLLLVWCRCIPTVVFVMMHCKVFDEMIMKADDVFLWNAILVGHVKVWDLESAKGLFDQLGMSSLGLV